MAKEMTAVEFLKGWDRICKDFIDDCNSCPVSKANREYHHCMVFMKKEPENAIAIMQKYFDSNKKTMQQDFFEKFPNAPKIAGKTPFACAKDCYPVTCYKEGHKVLCEKCWERPLEV